MTSGSRNFGCIEAGGTKFVLGVVEADGTVLAQHRIETTTPAETLGAAIDWMRREGDAAGGLAAIGIGSFGPISLDRAAQDYGYITDTTKTGWSNTPFVGLFTDTFGIPVGFDTDVNAAALAEYRWGASRGTPLSLYVTVGTGIGGGAIVDGKPLKGLSHPEMGHIRLARHPLDTDFAGSCPFHGDCLEGLAAGPAVKARWGQSLSALPQDHPGVEIIAYYLAQMVSTFQAIMQPAKIVLGGGVMGTPGLIDRVRQEADRLGDGYFRGRASEIVVPPALGDRAGLLGALALAQDALTAH